MVQQLDGKEKLVVAMAVVMAGLNVALVIGVVGTFYDTPLAEIAEETQLGTYSDPLSDIPVCVFIHDWMLPWNCMELQCVCRDTDPNDPCTCT